MRNVAERGQRGEPVFGRMPANLTCVGDPVQAGNLALALDPGRVTGGELADQGADALAQLEGEVRSGGAHELADIVHSDLAALAQAIGVLGLAHGRYGPCPAAFWGTTSRRASISAWTASEIALWSPISHPWL